MEKMKLNIQLFAVNKTTNSLTVVADSYNATNKTIQVKYLVELTTTGSSYNNNNITTTFYIDGVKYTNTHKLPKTTKTAVVNKIVTVPCPYPRTISANYSTPTDISAGTVTGSATRAVTPNASYKIRIKKNLPSGYTLRDYINAGGASCIDTGYYPKSTTKIVACYAFNSVTPTQQRIYGNGAGNLIFAEYINGSGAWAWASQNSSGNWTSTGVTANTSQHIFILDNKYNGVVLDSNSSYSAKVATTHSNTATVPIALGATRLADGTFENYANMKMYYFLIYENDVLIRLWVPCTRDSDSIAGLYDLINNVFYPSSTSTPFTAGNVVSGGFWIPGFLYYKNSGTWTKATRFAAKSGGTWTYQTNEYFRY